MNVVKASLPLRVDRLVDAEQLFFSGTNAETEADGSRARRSSWDQIADSFLY